MQLRDPLGALEKGTYTVTWRNTSAVDGHTTVGSVAFGIGVPATASDEGATSGVQSPSAASIAGRWLFYVGVVLPLGAAAALVGVAARPALSVWR